MTERAKAHRANAVRELEAALGALRSGTASHALTKIRVAERELEEAVVAEQEDESVSKKLDIEEPAPGIPEP